VGEIVRDITNLALEYDADIGIEDLKRFSPKNKKFNREVLRIPFYQFRMNLEARCFDKSITLHVVDAYHTSKWCSRCGAVAKSGHSSNYSLFKCDCGQTVNSDRKASLAVAVKTLLVRNKEHTLNKPASFQFTDRQVPVNGLLRPSDDFGLRVVHVNQSPMESHPF
jgi:IS605 OrfB family transposase